MGGASGTISMVCCFSFIVDVCAPLESIFTYSVFSEPTPLVRTTSPVSSTSHVGLDFTTITLPVYSMLKVVRLESEKGSSPPVGRRSFCSSCAAPRESSL